MPSKFNMMTATLATQGVVAKVTFLGPKSDDIAPAEQTSFIQAAEQTVIQTAEQTPDLMLRVLKFNGGGEVWKRNMKPTDTFRNFFDLFNEENPAPDNKSNKVLLYGKQLQDLMDTTKYSNLGELSSSLGPLNFSLMTVDSARAPKPGEFMEYLSTEGVWKVCLVTNVSRAEKKFNVDAKDGTFSFHELDWKYSFRLLDAKEAKDQAKLAILRNILTRQGEIGPTVESNDFALRYCLSKEKVLYDLDGIDHSEWFKLYHSDFRHDFYTYRDLSPWDLFQRIISESPLLFGKLGSDIIIRAKHESDMDEVNTENAALRYENDKLRKEMKQTTEVLGEAADLLTRLDKEESSVLAKSDALGGLRLTLIRLRNCQSQLRLREEYERVRN